MLAGVHAFIHSCGPSTNGPRPYLRSRSFRASTISPCSGRRSARPSNLSSCQPASLSLICRWRVLVDSIGAGAVGSPFGGNVAGKTEINQRATLRHSSLPRTAI